MVRWWDQRILQSARILVVGGGTTGNEVIKNLALLGISEVVVADMDEVEEVNLSRSVLFRPEDLGESKAEVAARRAHDLNPDTTTRAITGNIIYDVGSLEYGQYQAAILTVDNLEARMWVNRYCWLNGTALLDTGIQALNGNIMLVAPPDGPCIECGWDANDYEHIEDRYQCLKLGLGIGEEKIPMVITAAAVIGGMAAQEVVRFLHDRCQRKAPRAGTMSLYMGDSMAFLQWQQPRREDCRGHPSVIPLSEQRVLETRAPRDMLAGDIKARVAAELHADFVELRFDKEIVYGVSCNICTTRQSIDPVPLGLFERPTCPHCFQPAMLPHPAEKTDILPDDFTLAQLGIPANHLLSVGYARGDEVVEAFTGVGMITI